MPVKYDTPTQCEQVTLTGRKSYIQPLISHPHSML